MMGSYKVTRKEDRTLIIKCPDGRQMISPPYDTLTVVEDGEPRRPSPKEVMEYTRVSSRYSTQNFIEGA